MFMEVWIYLYTLPRIQVWLLCGGKQQVSDCISAMRDGVEYPTSFVEASQKREAQRAEQ